MVEPDFEELLRLFNRRRVRYCIVGAYAVAFHDRPRYTKDMDILLEPSIKNGERVVEALREFGFGSLKMTSEDFARPGRFIQLGYEPVRVDLLTSLKGISFDQAWKHRVAGRYGKVRVLFLGREELILNKETVGHGQDLVDLARLRPARARGTTRKQR